MDFFGLRKCWVFFVSRLIKYNISFSKKASQRDAPVINPYTLDL